MRREHTVYYFLEAVLLSSGFFVLLLTENAYNQGVLLLALLFMYIVIGAIHHKVSHDINLKIMLEYVLISALVFSVFLLFKSGAM